MIVPSPLLVTTPWEGLLTLVTVSSSSSGSVSLASTFTVPGVSSSVVRESSLAMGSSFTFSTVKV